jgi:hypothetical protein
VSYSHRNRTIREKFVTHLGPLKRTTKIEVWTDKQLHAGDNWEAAIMASLSQATIAVLLITADFLDSEFILNREVPALLHRREKDELRLIPILAKACAWELCDWLKPMQLLPRDAQPVWRKGGDVERELKLIVIELAAFAATAREAMRKVAGLATVFEEQQKKNREQQEKNARRQLETIERERRDQEAFVSKLMQSVHDSLAAIDNSDYETALNVLSRVEARTPLEQKLRRQVIQDMRTILEARKQSEAYELWDEYIRQA